MSDSDSDSGLKRVRSRTETLYNVAPMDTDFKIKIVDKNCDPIRLLYTLKEGQTLPYEPDLEGNEAHCNAII